MHSKESGDGAVDCIVVATNHRLSPSSVALANVLFDRRHGQVGVEEICEMEEAGLKHRVDPTTQARITGDGRRVHGPDAQSLGDDLTLRLDGKLVPYPVGWEGTVEQNGGTVPCHFEDIDALQEIELVDCHEVGLLHQVGGLDGSG